LKKKKKWRNEEKSEKLRSKARKKNKKISKNQTVPNLQRSHIYRR